MAEKKLVGFKKFTSKKGNPLCVAIVMTPFDSKANERGSYGCDVESVFLPQEQIDYLIPTDIGKPVDLNYNIVGGRAFLTQITVKR